MRRIRTLLFTMIMIGCCAVAGLAQENVSGAFNGGSKSEIAKVSLFPNPVVNVLNVEIDNPTINPVSFQLYNIIGNRQEFETEHVQDNLYKIYLRGLPKGYYLLSITEEKSGLKKAFRFQKR